MYFPNWSIDIVKRKLLGLVRRSKCNNDYGSEIFLTNPNSPLLTICRLSSGARAKGLREGMTLAYARTIFSKAYNVEFDPRDDFSTLYKIARWGFSFSPLSAVDEEIQRAYRTRTLHGIDQLYYGIILDLTGTERVHKGEWKLCTHIINILNKAGFEARAAISHTIGSAWAFSRFSRDAVTIFNPSHDLTLHLKQAVWDFPVEALRLSSDTISAFKDIGVVRLSHIFSLPRKALALRYKMPFLNRLDEFLGDKEETFVAVKPPIPWSVKQVFDIPLEKEEAVTAVIIFLLKNLLDKLAEKRRCSKSFGLIVCIQREDEFGERTRKTIQKQFSLYSATNKKDHLVSILHPLISSLKIDGAVLGIELCCLRVERIGFLQRALLQGSSSRSHEDDNISDEEQRSIDELLNHLFVTIGRSNIREASFVESYVPERSYKYSFIDEKKKEAKSEKFIKGRPTLLLKKPEELTAIALMPDDPPSWIKWRNMRLKIISGIGPEKIGDEWWKKQLQEVPTRNYYKVQDETGRWLWIFKSETANAWFLHGMWA